MEPRCRREVIELHRFFQDWFRGELEPTAEAFARFDSVIAESFVIIGPGGQLFERPPLVDRLRRGHGGWRDDEKSRIWIENVRLRHTAGELALLTYEEWQEIRGEVRGRLSSALFRACEGTPNRVEWLHVHETWLPEE